MRLGSEQGIRGLGARPRPRKARSHLRVGQRYRTGIGDRVTEQLEPGEVDATTADELDVEPTDSPADEGEQVRFEISSYPADYTVGVLVDKWRSGQLVIPEFQREYVWNLPQASRLIESFLLGLPVPQVFLYKERNSPRLLVVDGQQRLSTLAQFYGGVFDEDRAFRLTGVDPRWEGRSYQTLDEDDRLQLDDTPLRSIVIQQLQPNDHSSVYRIFERLNTGGTQLNPMEIRKALYHGPPFEFLRGLNETSEWRQILGQPRRDKRLRDVEFVLRVLALANGWREYVKPMKGFLNAYMEQIAQSDEEVMDNLAERFRAACLLIVTQLGQRPFHVRTRLNVAALDGVMATVIENVDRQLHPLDVAWRSLLNDEDFNAAISFDTSDTDTVRLRFELTRRQIVDE